MIERISSSASILKTVTETKLQAEQEGTASARITRCSINCRREEVELFEKILRCL